VQPPFSDQVPARFRPAVRAVERLAEDEDCLAALLFGSIARGEGTDVSDLDVHVVAREENACREINHPVVGGVKLDLSFRSFEQIEAATQDEIERRERVPIVAE
jgi:predicted nucleotidyltransferase